MEENTAAVESLILFYINTKHVLKTKQLDERVFLDQMMRHCKENGFDAYSNEEIRSTWKNLALKYVELKKTGTTEAKESWKYYEILDSCYDQSDFHNGVYPKFSEEMVWFLIECFLKRKGLEKTQKKNSMLHDIHKEFLQSGYLYITKQDIENKWKYLNLKYDKMKDDPESLKKLPYLQALTAFREKNKCLVKMIFTRELTEILIERFTEKKITCVIHGYDSEQLLNEIQSEFRDLGFDFSQEEIKSKWKQLTNVYTFLKSKGKQDSSWVYFNAMKEHFKDDFMFGSGKIETEMIEDSMHKSSLRQRSKSVGADARIRYNHNFGKTKLVVNIEQLNKETLLPTSPDKLLKEKKKRAPKRKSSPKKITEEIGDDLHIPPKKTKRSKSKGNSRKNKNKSGNSKVEIIKYKFPKSLLKGKSKSVKKGNQLTKLTIDRNTNQERRSSTDIGSPGSKVHIINIDESKIDKKSGNLTINLPSITKQFSDNEFLPLKKRLRVDEDSTNKHPVEKKDIKDGFLGFPREDEEQKLSKSEENESKRLTEEEMAEIMERISQDKSDKHGITSNVYSKNPNYYKPEGLNYNYQEPYNSFNQPCLIIPKEERQDNLSVENYNPTAITPPPVLLLVIKVDGSNNPLRDGDVTEDKKTLKNKVNAPEKNEPRKSNGISKTSQKKDSFVKPITPKSKNCTVTQSEPVISGGHKSKEVNVSPSKSFNTNLNKPGSKNKKYTTIQNANVKAIQNTEVRSNEGTSIQIKHSSPVKLTNTKNNSCPIALNENKVVLIRSPEEKNKDLHNTQSMIGKTSNAETAIHVQSLPSPQKVNGKANEVEVIAVPTVEKNITISPPQQANIPKKIRLPVKGGGNVKEIFISPRELSKLTKMKPGDVKVNTSPIKQTNDDNLAENKVEMNATPQKTPPKFKFISQVIKPPALNNTSEKVAPKANTKVQNPVEPVNEVNSMLPPTAIAASTKFLGTNCSSNISSRNLKNEEFENESVFSEAVGDDDCLKDNLLTTVIDFQEQNNQEFVEIKNLMKQNNLLQRETNRLLRLMLEKM